MESNQLKPYMLDIETRGDKTLEPMYFESITPPGNLKDPDKIEMAMLKKREDAGKEMAVDTDMCEIICIGVKVLGEEPQLFNLREFVDWYNTPVKANATDIGMRTNGRRKLIGFNTRNFDLVVLIKAAIKAGMTDFPYADFKMMLDKYKGQSKHLDVMEALSMVWGKNKSMDKYLQIYLGKAKTPIDFATASEEEIRRHNVEDLVNLELLYKKFKPLFV